MWFLTNQSECSSGSSPQHPAGLHVVITRTAFTTSTFLKSARTVQRDREAYTRGNAVIFVIFDTIGKVFLLTICYVDLLYQ